MADPFPTEIVGESFYFKNFIKLFGRRGEDGIDEVVDASVEPDDNNEYDENAVAVYIRGLQVGHLSRTNAKKYRQLIDLGAVPERAMKTKARVRGGWDRASDDKGEFGVRLAFDLASACREHWITSKKKPEKKEEGCISQTLGCATLLFLLWLGFKVLSWIF